MLGVNNASVPVYVIYYGNHFPSTTQPIIDNFIRGLNSAVNQTTRTAPFAVNSSYCEASVTNCPAPGRQSTSISGVLNCVNSIQMTPSQGSSVNTTAVTKILQTALTTGGLPADNTAIYALITDPTIKVTGFPEPFLRLSHSFNFDKAFNIHYAFAPDPATLSACDGNFANGQTTTPNADAGEITDSLMHEFSETVSDPDISAWFTSNGEENGDLCNFNYGAWSALTTWTNGAKYNKLVANLHFAVGVWPEAFFFDAAGSFAAR